MEVNELIRVLQSVNAQGSGVAVANATGGQRRIRAGAWDSVVDSPSGAYMHGPGGIFGVLGLERDVISTRVIPRGLIGALPARSTNVLWPTFAYLTGFLASDTPDDDQGVCDDPPTVGGMKSCTQVAQFGRLSYQTRTLDIGRIRQQINRGEFMDLRLVNSPLAGLPQITPSSAVVSDAELIDNEMKGRMAEVGVAYQNKLLRLLYTGNPSNNNTGGGYREFPGLDILIGTDKMDAVTGQQCPSLDSYIHDFNNVNVDNEGGNTFITWATAIMRYLRSNATRMGLDPATWVISMKEELFYLLTALWPCSYLTTGCTFRSPLDGSVMMNVDAKAQIDMRDAMRQGSYLLFDGIEVRVVLDDGIVERTHTTDPSDVPSGDYSSDVYFINTTVVGNLATAYMEYYDYSDGLAQVQEARLARDFWTDGGRFLWMPKPPQLQCVQLASAMEPRVIIRAPQLCARITNVNYTPMIHNRDAIIGDANYVNGGVTDRSGWGPSYHAEWGNVF